MKIAEVSIVLVVATALLAGCESMGKQDEQAQAATVEDRSVGATAEGATARGIGMEGGFGADALDDPSSPLSRRIVYFDFDSSTITPDGRAIVETHAAYLAQYPGVSVVLEGHADERGTREYNVALGEQRARAVTEVFELLGVSSRQMEVVSYGEERPATEGQDEASWRLNRRVEIVYQR